MSYLPRKQIRYPTEFKLFRESMKINQQSRIQTLSGLKKLFDGIF